VRQYYTVGPIMIDKRVGDVIGWLIVYAIIAVIAWKCATAI
jgi:hypothetical protein